MAMIPNGLASTIAICVTLLFCKNGDEERYNKFNNSFQTKLKTVNDEIDKIHIERMKKLEKINNIGKNVICDN